MDSEYPDGIDTFRDIENLPGITYDAAKKKILYAEDIEALANAIVQIELTLGTNPEGDYATVKNRLNALTTGVLVFALTDTGDHQHYDTGSNTAVVPTFLIMNNGAYDEDDANFPYTYSGTQVIFAAPLPSDLAGTRLVLYVL